MTIKPYRAILLCALVLSASLAKAQKNTTITGKADSAKLNIDTAKTQSVKFGINYTTNDTFMGRADSIRTAIIIPQIRYDFASGIYLSGSLYIVPNRKKNKLDGGDFTFGYDFDITDDLSGGLSYAKLFYNSSSTQVNSSVSSTFNGNLTYDIGDIVSPTINADYNINKQGITGDIFLNFGLSHEFTVNRVFGAKDVLIISPSAEINTGTQNFYGGYVDNRKLRNAKRDAAETALIQAYTTELSQYKILDYEFSVPVEYKYNSFIFNFTSTYALVQNQFKSATLVKTLGLSNQSSVFYFDIGVAFKF